MLKIATGAVIPVPLATPNSHKLLKALPARGEAHPILNRSGRAGETQIQIHEIKEALSTCPLSG
jgi:hypothetical protein